LREQTNVSTETLLRESGYSEKTIAEILKYYGQPKKKNKLKTPQL